MQPVLDVSELPVPPRTRSLSFYVVLLFLVLPVWSAIPLSWLFVIYSLASLAFFSFSFPARLLFALALAEVLFSLYQLYLARKVVSTPTPYGPADTIEVQTAYARLLKSGLANLPDDGGDEESLDSERPASPAEAIVQLQRNDPRAVDFRNSIRTWFCRIPWSSIKLRQIHEWLYWSIYNTDLPDQMSSVHRAALDDAVQLLEKRSGTKIQEGSDPVVKPMRVTIDKVHILLRPLTFYLIVNLLNKCLKILYRRKWNVRQRSTDGLEYLIRVPKKWDPVSGPRPLVILHGLGLGIFQYHLLLAHLFETLADRPILVLLQPQISQDFFHPRYLKPMSRHQTADRLAMVLRDLGWVHADIPGDLSETLESEEEKDIANSLTGKKRGITLMSHSNGSYTHAWMLKGYPKLVARSCFVDPVTFCSWEGDVCYNFIYRPSMTGIELIMRYFVATELGVANLLHRHFEWTANALWFEEIPDARDPSKNIFILGGKDDIINSQRVKRYLTSHGINKGLRYDPQGRHGQALITGGSGHAHILKWLQNES